jgi:molybdopterin-guanine dinucleotide biosynthesis protein A
MAGLVLCGGRSSRMGRDKALIEIEGEPLVRRVARLLAEAASPVILAPGRPGRLGELGLAEVEDERPDSGPLAGIVAGLAASPTRLLAVVAVDMPLASPAVFRLLASLHRGEDAVVPVTSSGPQPLHAVYSVSALGALRVRLMEGDLRLGDALARLRVREVVEEEWAVADPTGRFAFNLNAEGDLGAL